MPCALQTSAVLAVSPLVIVSGVSIGKKKEDEEKGKGGKRRKGKEGKRACDGE
jgi:hypothetical protein